MTDLEIEAHPQCVTTLSGQVLEHHNSTIKLQAILGVCLADLIISPGGWDVISSTVQQRGKTTFEYAYRRPGTEKNCWHGVATWELKGDRLYGVMLHHFDVTKAWKKGVYRIRPVEIVSKITSIADISTEGNVKIRHNDSINSSVPEMHWTPESLRVAARNAFQRLPLLTHKEILERSTLEPADKLRIYCESKEDAIALYEGRWDLAGCAVLLYPQTEFELYIVSKDQPPRLYKAFSEKEALLAGRAQRRELQTMIDGQLGNGHKKGLLLPTEWSFTEIFNSVMYSPDTMTLVTEAESKPIIVSRQYAELTNKSVSYWVGAGSINKAGWAPGELEKMQAYLERDGFLQNYEYKAYLHDFDEVTTWYTSFQRIFCDGEYMRVAKVLDIVKANLVTI